MFSPAQLISPQYVVLQRLLHRHPAGYGTRGNKWVPAVLDLIAEFEASSVLDYGCGQGTLKRDLAPPHLPSHVRVDEYDPGIEGKDGMASFADLIVCTDVLEHVEPDKLENVLAHLRGLARKAVFVVVALIPDSGKVLADGRNAHLIVRPAKWWRKHFQAAGFSMRRAPASARKKKSHECAVVLIP